MKPLGTLFLAILAIAIQASAAPIFASQPSAEPVPATQVERLIEALASPVPPPHQNQDHDFDCLPVRSPSPDGTKHCQMVFTTGYQHPQVTEATEKLKAMGSKIYPILIRALGDERYSYSSVAAAWINYSVGSKVKGILGDGIEFYAAGYKSRNNPKGSNMKPSFSDYLADQKIEDWAARAAKTSKLELRKEFVAWVIGKEKAYGFVSESQQQEILAPYQTELERIEGTLKQTSNP